MCHSVAYIGLFTLAVIAVSQARAAPGFFYQEGGPLVKDKRVPSGGQGGWEPMLRCELTIYACSWGGQTGRSHP